METNNNIHSSSLLFREHVLGITILVAFLLPHTSIIFQLINPLLCILLVVLYTQRKWNKKVLIAIVPIFFSFIFNISNLSPKAAFSIISLLLFFSLFPFVGKAKLSNFYIYFCLSYIVVSQFVYLLGLQALIDYFDRVYPISDDDLLRYEHVRNTITFEGILNYRLGGLYHNPNQCARSLTMLLAFYLILNQNNNNNRYVLFFTFITYVATLLTGSRTGFVISTLILYFGLLHQKTYSRSIRFLFFFIVILGLVYVIGTGVSLRGLDVERGFHHSSNLKWDTFLYYLGNEHNIMYVLFGHGDSLLFKGQYGVSMNNFDSEYGELIFRFGIVGFIGVYLFWWAVARRIDKGKRFFFFLLLWTISSTIVASYRAFFIFILLLSVVYANSKIYNGGVIKKKELQKGL